MKKVVFFGTYNPVYPRNRLLRRWTADIATIIEVNEHGGGIGKYVRLARALRRVKDYDAIIIGFPGHIACIVARLVSRRPIVFDAFISLYDTYVFDRASTKPGTFRAWYYWCIDWLAFHAATIVVIDTPEHEAYVSRSFGIPRVRIRVVPVVTDISLFSPMPHTASTKKVIWWHGKYSRLHSVPYIIELAKILRNEPDLEFRLLGSGGDIASIRASVETLKLQNVIFLPSVPYADLPKCIAAADICLGIFGSSDKVDRVVPNKLYEYIACGKPVVTRRSRAVERISNGLPIRLVGTDPSEGAEAIRELLRTSFDTAHVQARVHELYSEAERTWKKLI